MKHRSKPGRLIALSITWATCGWLLASCASGDDGLFPAASGGATSAGGLPGFDASTDSPGTGGLGGGGNAPPTTCGNGVVDVGELCDGANLNGESCASATMNAAPMGNLACGPTCNFDTAGCTGGGTGGTGGGTGGMTGTGGATGGTGGTTGGTCNPAFCPSTFGTPCCQTPNGPCGCDMGMGCMTCGGPGGS